MTQADLRDDNIPVAKTETITTLRQTIRPPDQNGIPRLLEALWAIMRRGKFTGHVTLHLNQGGVRDIVTEERISE